MPKAFRPRPAPRRPPGPHPRGLPRDIRDELNRTARAGQQHAAMARLERAIELLERGDAKGAATEARTAKALAPRSPTVREILGLALYVQDRFGEALSEMQAYRRMSGRADQNHIIADCLRAAGHPERAVPLAEEALAARGVPLSAKAEAVIVASSALADMGKFDEALGLLRRMKTRDDVAGPEVLRVWYVMADILQRAGRTQEAERTFRRIMRHDPAAYDVAERLAQLG